MRRRRTGRFENNAMFDGEDINPMDGMANLADMMLVFACGLMLALITYWNVDVSGVTGGVNADVGRKSSSSRREVKRTLRKMAANTKSTARSTATRRPASSTWWRTAMRNKVLLPALLLCLVLLLSACAKQADISDYAQAEIEISGLTDEDFTVTPQALLSLDCVERTATGRSEKAGTVAAKGPAARHLPRAVRLQGGRLLQDSLPLRRRLQDRSQGRISDGLRGRPCRLLRRRAASAGAEAASHPHPGGREQHVGVQRGSHRV